MLKNNVHLDKVVVRGQTYGPADLVFSATQLNTKALAHFKTKP